ncbi:MAG: cache domain-containing protein, partial [Thermodesulfovibrionia bacterium]|nr:cache domain-containing protein [Thermodesulfovibrionia bacterium]
MFKLKSLKEPTIARKLLISFLMISLLPIVLVGYLTFKTSEKEIKEETLENLQAIAESKEALFNDYFMGKEREVRELAFSPTVINASEKYHVAFHRGGVDYREYISLERKYSIYFTNFINEFGYYDLFFIDTDGNVILTVKKEGDIGTNLYTGHYKYTELAKIYKEVMKPEKTGISDFKHYAPSNEPAIFVGAPVVKEGNIIGALILQLSTEELYREVQNYIGLGQTGEIVIASREGNEAVFTIPLRHDPEAAFNRRVVLGSKDALPIQKAVLGENGAGLSVDYRNKEILAVWRYLPHLRWGIVVKMDTDEA